VTFVFRRLIILSFKELTLTQNLKKSSENYVDKLINKLEELNQQRKNQIEISQVKKAIDCAVTYHGNQKRLSGEPYYAHPLLVAYLIALYSDAGYPVTTDTIVAAILHDIVEDTDFTINMVALIFGQEVAEIVFGLTRDRAGEKLSVPELLESVVEKEYSILKEEKVDWRTSLSYFCIVASWPALFYLVYVYFADLLKHNFKYTGADIL